MRTWPRSALAAALAVLAAAATGLGVGPVVPQGQAAANPTAASTTPGRTALAPYIDVSLDSGHRFVLAAVKHEHLSQISAGFVIAAASGGCTPAWDDGVPIRKSRTVNRFLDRLRAAGVSVIPSFGGAAGHDLATTCTGKADLVSAYRSVIDRLHATAADFDIEGAAFGDAPSIRRRFAAIATLQRSDPSLAVSITIPVNRSGLDADGTSLLRAAKTAGVRLSLVNIMTMDYGTPVGAMGRTAINAAKATLAQVRRNYDRHARWSTIGITPMIGQNDTRSEVFGLADTKRVARFARARHIGRLAFWSLDRDRACPRPERSARSNCSGVPQRRYAFTRAFASSSGTTVASAVSTRRRSTMVAR